MSSRPSAVRPARPARPVPARVVPVSRARAPRPSLHDPAAAKAIEARLARIEGQVRAVRRMVSEEHPCEDIAMQLSAARKALDRVFFEMVSCMIRDEPGTGAAARAERARRVAELLTRFA